MNPAYAAVLECQDTYDPKAKWDMWFNVDDVAFGLRRTPDADVWSFRGSDDIPDWFHDIQGWPTYSHYLGFVHSGFYHGIEASWLHVLQNMRLDKEQKVNGHSLGAAHACMIAGMMVRHNIIVDELIAFGCPRPGFSELAKLNQQCTFLKLVKNCDDPVTEVPWMMGLYKHACPQTLVNEPGTGDDLFKDHHIALYVAGVQKLYGT
ncbi:MAG: hypothetical protein KGI54_18990 [Pseudomonadota bacterium]|nr:hypothetical protein [Pseudomonadota bacterium]